jgi:folate-binding protein YgfZ
MEITDTAKVITTALADVHRAAGARMGAWFGCELPDDFGDVREEQRFPRESVAVIDKNYHAYLTFTGPDRVRYLNAILTNDIKNLAVGESNISLLLNPQGRILAEIATLALPDKLLCISHAMIRARLVEVLEKYIIMDDVTLADHTDEFGTLAINGPRTPELIRQLTAIDFAAISGAAASHASASVGPSLDVAVRNIDRNRSAISCRLVRQSENSAEFIAARKDLPMLWKILCDAAKASGGGPIGYSAWSAISLAQGVPWFGYDFGEKQIPHEAGLQDSHISYTKGCYTGQEIVERVRSRGQVNRRRVGLRFADDAKTVRAAGASLLLDGAEAGFVTRAAQSFFPPAILAMGYVRKEGGGVGTVLDCGGEKVSVVNLPLADSSLTS